MDRKLLRLCLVPFLLMLLGLSFTGTVVAAEKYLVGVQVFHLGELIAKPVIEVEAGKTMGGQYSMPSGGQYSLAVVVRPVADNQVYVSLQFTSGKLKVQPNILVDIDKQTSTTVDKVRMVLLVQKVVKPQQAEQLAFHD